jgi:hypothetical protein
MSDRAKKYTFQANGIRPFGLTELQDISVVGTWKLPAGRFGGGLYRFGDKLYREFKASAGYANKWNPLLAGITLHYTHIGIHSYGSAGAMGINLGAGMKLTKRGWIGITATNINRPSIGKSKENLPQAMGLGSSWQLGERALFVTEIIKALHFPLSWRGGIEMKIVGPLLARLGAHTNPTAWSAGIGLNMDQFTFDFGIEHHQMLGMSYGIGLGINSDH